MFAVQSWVNAIGLLFLFLTNKVNTQAIRQSNKHLPVGKNEIRSVLTGDFVYVDKTGFALKLLRRVHRNRRHFFIARPSRFGKTLFVDTLEAILLGEKELFRGTEIYRSKYRWIEYPVLRFDFRLLSSGDPKIFLAKLEDEIRSRWSANRLITLADAPNERSNLTHLLKGLVKNLRKKFNRRVVVLVDEYDVPCRENVENAEAVGQFFVALNRVRSRIHFTFVTGVYVFVFPLTAAITLQDLTTDPDFAQIMGYTEDELRNSFVSHIERYARERPPDEVYAELDRRCNGYRFSNESHRRVCNPNAVLQYLRNETVSPETPQFVLRETLKKPVTFRFLTSGLKWVMGHQLAAASKNQTNLPGLLYQSGSLTINEYSSKCDNRCNLAFPNGEVEDAFRRKLADEFFSVEACKDYRRGRVVRIAVLQLDFDTVVAELTNYFEDSVYELLPRERKYYEAYVFAFFQSCSVNPKRWQDGASAVGALGVWFVLGGRTFVIRLEVDGSSERAVAQVNRYRSEFVLNGERKGIICAVGMNFDSVSRKYSWKAIVFSKSGERVAIFTHYQ